MSPQKYVRYTGLRKHDFREECEGVPSFAEIAGCVALAAIVSIVASIVF